MSVRPAPHAVAVASMPAIRMPAISVPATRVGAGRRARSLAVPSAMPPPATAGAAAPPARWRGYPAPGTAGWGRDCAQVRVDGMAAAVAAAAEHAAGAVPADPRCPRPARRRGRGFARPIPDRRGGGGARRHRHADGVDAVSYTHLRA